MERFLSADQFERVYSLLHCERKIHTKQREQGRLFLEAIFWMSRSGAQWRFLPAHYGAWNGVYKRFARWDDLGVSAGDSAVPAAHRSKSSSMADNPRSRSGKAKIGSANVLDCPASGSGTRRCRRRSATPSRPKPPSTPRSAPSGVDAAWGGEIIRECGAQCAIRIWLSRGFRRRATHMRRCRMLRSC